MPGARTLALELTARVSDAARPGATPPPGLSLLGVGQVEVMEALVVLEGRTRRSALSLHPSPTFDPEDNAYEMAERSRHRGVTLRMITPPRSLRFNPLLTSVAVGLRLGPVGVKCILLDGQAAVVAGPDTEEGDTTAWIATSGEPLDLALRLWDASLASSRPALPEGASPPLDARQVQVARGVCLGATDAAIARQLGISERTVAREVATILRVTGAGSRAEAVLNMLGRGRQSRA
jgi:DNA-binding CsgD family transcriptional regulator